MAKTPKNHGNPWSKQNLNQLQKLADQNTPTRLIAYKMGRTTDSIYNASSTNGIPLSPTNQSPYNRKK